MELPCRKIKDKKRKDNEPVVKGTKAPSYNNSCTTISDNVDDDDGGDDGKLYSFGEVEDKQPENKLLQATINSFREWLNRQRFIPKDLSNELLASFLSAACYNLEAAEDKMLKYFYSRQEPSFLFRNRDILSPENVKILNKIYVIPMPDTTEDGRKIIITGLIEPTTQYNQMDHAKILALVLDLLIWEKDFGFGDFVIILDGSGFECPQLLQNKVFNHKSIRSLLLDTIPGTLRSFYLLYPPLHVANVADTRNNIWIKVIKSKQEMISHVPANNLPLEYGGNLGHVVHLIEQWNKHLHQSRNFFINFEKRMIFDYKRKLCHENEIRAGGEYWVHKMKLEADEWEYKIKYYERMRTMKPLTHPGFGSDRIKKPTKPKPTRKMNDCELKAKEEKEKDLLWSPPKLYCGYAKEIQKAKLEAEKSEKEKLCDTWTPVLTL